MSLYRVVNCLPKRREEINDLLGVYSFPKTGKKSFKMKDQWGHGIVKRAMHVVNVGLTLPLRTETSN
eukprot:c57014_g1_i1 orf=2-199(-)